jgi:hypothetical protein
MRRDQIVARDRVEALNPIRNLRRYFVRVAKFATITPTGLTRTDRISPFALCQPRQLGNLRICLRQSGLIGAQRVKPSGYVEQFFVDAGLAQTVKAAAQRFQQIIDVLVGPLHGGQTAGVLARQ